MATYNTTTTKAPHSYELNLCSPQNAYSFKSLVQCFKAADALNDIWKGMSLVV
jgi:hypothetical protein